MEADFFHEGEAEVGLFLLEVVEEEAEGHSIFPGVLRVLLQQKGRHQPMDQVPTRLSLYLPLKVMLKALHQQSV